MNIGEELARARTLSNDALLASLSSNLGSSRRLMALVVAHLGELEERRLHLLAGHGSIFEYCTARLGMSEDEACRRIEVARLARRFPELLERIASGTITLSVAAMLKHHLTSDNHAELLDAMSCTTVVRAREVLAALFPRPDVGASIRKLPERRPASANEEERRSDGSSPLFVSMGPAAVEPASIAPAAERRGSATASPSAPDISTLLTGARPLAEQATAAARLAPEARMPPSRSTRPSSNIHPLSPGRFRVTFTADAELKRKLDLARDLLRHSLPSGDLPSIVGRALDLLIEKIEKRRFATTSQPRPSKTAASAVRGAANATREWTTPAPATGNAAAAGGQGAAATAPAPVELGPDQIMTPPAPPPQPPRARYLPAAVRRAVHERDGMRCSWQAPDGTHCSSRAWLEHDHIIPRGQGGSNEPANIRPYCRAHNRLAAEQAYGATIIARIIARRRATRDSADGTTRGVLTDDH